MTFFQTINMKKILPIALLLFAQSAFAEEFSMKGVKFGMSAEEIVAITGGSTSDGCKHVFTNFKFGTKWSYGGVTNWMGRCIEEDLVADRDKSDSYIDKEVAKNYSGLYRIVTSVSKSNYSFDKLISIFKERFKSLRKISPTSAWTTEDGALITMREYKVNIEIKITGALYNNLAADALNKRLDEQFDAWEKLEKEKIKKEQQKLEKAKRDF